MNAWYVKRYLPCIALYTALADTVCDRITAAIVQKQVKEDSMFISR